VGLAGAEGVLVSWVLTSVVATVVTVVWMLPRLRPGMRLTLDGAGRELRRLRRSLVGHHLINLAQAVPSFLLPILVMARLGAPDSAYFYLTWMVASALFMVSPAVASALFAERANGAGARSGSVRRAAVIVAGVLALPLLVLLVARGRVLSVFGTEYADRGGDLLGILVLAAVPDAVTNIAVGCWRAESRLRRCLGINAVMATVCLGGSWLLLPPLGVRGPGVAWLAAQTVGTAMVAVHIGLDRRGRADRRVPA
jgi:O-antigen/teichoic acid export membrane protein